MQVLTQTQGRFTIATILDNRMDATVAPQLKNSIAKLINEGHNCIILDISAVTFMDSSSLGALVSLLKMLGNRGDLIITGAKGIEADLFKLTRMDRVFRMAADVDTALGARLVPA